MGIPCEFRACNILSIGAEYERAFDLVFFTIGAITWFQDLEALFSIAARCLRPGGTLLLEDFHPVVGMLPLPGEEPFDPDSPDRIAYSISARSHGWSKTAAGIYQITKTPIHLPASRTRWGAS